MEGYSGSVEFVSEDWGKSALAARYGIDKYPVVFVDDIILAQPRDFYGWNEKVVSKYAPWGKQANQDHFKADLKAMVNSLLVGNHSAAASAGSAPDLSKGLTNMPDLHLMDLNGREVSLASLKGRPVIVEFWATWCVPCRPTAVWLSGLQKRYGKKLAVVAIAMESPKADLTKFVSDKKLAYPNIEGNAHIATAFGGIFATPTMYVFDAKGKTALAQFGAPPELHNRVEALLPKLMK